MSFFDINNIAFEVLSYPLSYIELIGTAFGLLSVYLASRAHIWTWPTGIVNEFAFFWLFYQVQLYADMLLQVYFLVVTLYGWYYWSQQEVLEKVNTLGFRSLRVYAVVLIVGSLLLGWIISDIHHLLPTYFPEPAAYPYPDAFTTVASILATILLSRKQIESWYLWIAVDLVSIVLYTLKGIHVVAIEYFVFLLICIFGYLNWRKKM